MGADLHIFDLKKPGEHKVEKDPEFLWFSFESSKIKQN